MINDINLIPKSSKNTSRETLFVILGAYLCFTIVVVFFGYFIPLQQKSSVKHKIAEKEEELKQYADMDDTYIKLTDTISEMENKVTYFEALKNSLKMSKVFNDLEENIPREINISNMSLAEGILTIAGVSPSYKEVAQYMVKIRGVDYVKDVTFSSAVLEDDEEDSNKKLYDFNIYVNLDMPKIELVSESESTEDTNEEDTSEDTEGETVENEAN